MLFPATSDKFLETENGKTHYRYIEVEGAPVACVLPGFSFPSAVYVPFAKSLSDSGFSVLIMDYYGRGFSIASEKVTDYNPSLFANQFLELIKHLEIDNIVLISFSYGSLVAAHLTSLEPSIVSRIVMVSPFKCLRSPVRPVQKIILSHKLIGPWLLSYTAGKFIPEDIAYQLGKSKDDSELLWSLVSASMLQINENPMYYSTTSNLMREADEIHYESELSVLRQIPVKSLILFGKEDKIINVDEAQTWFKAIMLNVKFAVIPECGHLLFLEKNDDVINEISQFLKHI